MNELVIWVLTGGVACGKSLVSRRIAEILGPSCQIFSSDDAVHQAYENPETQAALVQAFGAEVLSTDKAATVDRKYLGKLAFSNSEARQTLESLVHPKVWDAFNRAYINARNDPSVNLLVAEVPLYYETNSQLPADLVIVVASSPDQQVLRLMQHRNLSRERSDSILASQQPLMDKVAAADAVLWNDGDLEALEDQILTLIATLQT